MTEGEEKISPWENCFPICNRWGNGSCPNDGLGTGIRKRFHLQVKAPQTHQQVREHLPGRVLKELGRMLFPDLTSSHPAVPMSPEGADLSPVTRGRVCTSLNYIPNFQVAKKLIK